MAGNYPSPTARRINYDLDGTRCWRKTANASSTTLVEDSTFLANMNDESGGTTPVVTLAWNSSTNPGHAPFILLKFPHAVDITGISAWQGHDLSPAVSNDTTNGVDGTWTTGTTVTPTTTSTIVLQKEWSRSGSITSQSFVGVRWLRLSLPTGSSGNRTVGKVLIYGSPNSSADALEFWDPSSDEIAAPDLFEFGDRARGTAVTKEFRIKNLSTILKATDITVARAITTDTSPSVTGFHLFSLDEVSWFGSLDIGDLDPEEISPVIYFRQDVPTDAALWLWQMVVTATPDGWEAP